jgi:polyhydroxybutyrate depolymerase
VAHLRFGVVAGLVVQACTPSGDTQDDSDLSPRTFPDVIGGERPAPVIHPASYDPDEPLPAVILLHGYGVTAVREDALFGLGRRVDAGQFLLVLPEGTVDAGGLQFWNAGVECCGDDGPPVDDVAYLGGLVEELRATWRVGSVTFVGHSNGGYMSYRLACETPDVLDRMVVLAGSDQVATPTCVDGHPIGLLHVHGTADEDVPYEAAAEPHATPGAEASVLRQAERSGCAKATTDLGTADLLSRVDGEESTGAGYEGCSAPVALWTAHDGDHLFLTATDLFRDGVVAFALGGPAAFP